MPTYSHPSSESMGSVLALMKALENDKMTFLIPEPGGGPYEVGAIGVVLRPPFTFLRCVDCITDLVTLMRTVPILGPNDDTPPAAPKVEDPVL